MYPFQRFMQTPEYTYRKIWTITYPILISLVMQQMLGITDTAFLGRVGEVELGASAIGGIYYLVVFMIGHGFSVGAEIVMGRRNGEKNYGAIGKVFFHGLVFLVALAAVMFAVSLFGAQGMLRKFISSPDVFEAAWTFTRWRIFGFFFSFSALIYKAFYMATTRTRVLTANALVMVGSNVVLNYVLIFGKLGFPALGIAGSGIASALSELISLAFFVAHTHSRRSNRIYGLFRSLRFSFRTLAEMLKVSVWTMIQFFFSSGTWLFFFIAIEHLGERPLAISNMVRNVGSILYLFVSAFGTACAAMVTNLMGAGKSGEVMALCRRILWMTAAAMLPLVLFTGAFPRIALRLYTDNADLVAAAVPSLMVLLGGVVIGAPAYVYFFAIAGSGNTKAAMWIELSVLAVYGAWTWCLVFVMRADVAWCWTTEGLYNALMFAASYLYMRKSRWRERKI